MAQTRLLAFVRRVGRTDSKRGLMVAAGLVLPLLRPVFFSRDGFPEGYIPMEAPAEVWVRYDEALSLHESAFVIYVLAGLLTIVGMMIVPHPKRVEWSVAAAVTWSVGGLIALMDLAVMVLLGLD